MIKKFENFNNDSILIIIDVQKSFKKFFSEMYLNELNKYCNKFVNVYQIWDNHSDKDADNDYLYSDKPVTPIHDDLYTFPNQKALVEKRYQYDVDVSFYKKILDKKAYNDIYNKEKNNQLKKGDYFLTNEGTIIIYIGNNHVWYHVPKKLYNLFQNLKGKKVVMVGGSLSECFLDIETTAISLGVDVKVDYKYTYSASHCYF